MKATVHFTGGEPFKIVDMDDDGVKMLMGFLSNSRAATTTLTLPDGKAVINNAQFTHVVITDD